MTALLLDTFDATTSQLLERVRLARAEGYDEKWLQRLLFQHPALVPLESFEPGAGPFLPLCREFSLPRSGGNVFLDLLGVTRNGRIVLVECKLWRNPQARREVIAQVLEYAALLRGWRYGDLTARLAATQGWRGDNPLFAQACRVAPGLDEATFVDGVAASLATGDFHLIVAGDGIRSDLQAIATHLNAPGSSCARLALLEVQLWADASGRTMVVPHVPMRTEVIEQRVVLAADRTLLRLEPITPIEERADSVAVPAATDPARAATRETNRAFWDAFIADARFDHPDQGAPRHGGNNWVRLDLPAPATSLTIYRSGSTLGLFATLAGSAGAALFDNLAVSLNALRAESQLDLTLSTSASDPFKGAIGVKREADEGAGFSDQEARAWLIDGANRMINLLRPRLAQKANASPLP